MGLGGRVGSGGFGNWDNKNCSILMRVIVEQYGTISAPASFFSGNLQEGGASGVGKELI